jgi:small-conductance mechanosensitive channel
LAALAIASSASADRLGTSNVAYYPGGSAEVTLHLGESVDYPWVFYNGENASVYVNLTAEVSPVGAAAMAYPSFTILAPGEWAQIVLRFTAPDEGAHQTGTVLIHLTAVNLQTYAVAEQDATLPITLIGITPPDDPTGKFLGIWPNPLPPPFDGRIVAFAISLSVWAAIAAGLVFVVDPIVKAIAKRTATKVDDIILRILRAPVFALVLLYGIVNSLSILGLPPEWQRLLFSVYGFTIILLLTWVAYRVFRDLLVSYGNQLAKRTRSGVNDRLVPALEKVGAVVIVLLGVLLAMQSIGTDITLFLAGFGVAGLVIAFAAQDTLSNFFAGMHIMLDRPFRAGDMIELDDGTVCRVQDIGLRSTKLYWGKSHAMIIMPNKEMANRKIVNYVRPDRRFIINVKVGVSYDSDLNRVRRAMMEVVNAHPWVLKDPGFEPIWRVLDFAESAIVVMIIVWVDDVDHQWQLGSDLRERIKQRFDEEGIEIPFPRRVVTLEGNPSTVRD